MPDENILHVFISYKHNFYDQKILRELLVFTRNPFSLNGLNLWADLDIETGENWDDQITNNLEQADFAILLISQNYLDSKYIIEKEVSTFLRKQKEEGLILFPIIISPSTWEYHEWLAKTQFLPKNGKTLEVDYKRPGQRKILYKQITNSIITQSKQIHSFKSKLDNENDQILCQNCRSTMSFDKARISEINKYFCSYCFSEFTLPLKIQFGSMWVTLTPGKKLFPYHYDQKKFKIMNPIATVTPHPNVKEVWGLTNLSEVDWIRIKNGKETKIRPKDTVLIEPNIELLFEKHAKGIINIL